MTSPFRVVFNAKECKKNCTAPRSIIHRKGIDMFKDQAESEITTLQQPIVLFFVFFILSIIISIFIIVRMENDRIIIARAKASQVAGSHVSSIESVINNNLSVNHSLAMLIYEGGEGRIDKLEELGEQILNLYPNIYNISLAPNGIIQDILPLEGNKEAIGHDLFKDNRRSTEAMDTKESGVLTVAGPFELIQGGYSIVGRLPVFLSDEKGNQEFWGFTCVAMLIDDILNEAEIEGLEKNGYDYELWKINPDTNEKEIISSSKSQVIEGEEEKVILPNGEWILGISPIGGWKNKKWIIINIIVALLTSGFVSIFFWMVAKLRISKLDLEKIAFLDGLTGLPNRRLFFDRLNQAIGHSNREGTLLAVCYMDLDGFKDINDSLGHKAGDQVLMEISRRYRNILRKTDTVSRLGGDEFAVLIPYLKDKEECIEILERIQSTTMEPIIFEEHSIKLSISIGVAMFPCGSCNDDDLLRNADLALYKVKEEGKGQYKFYN